jgi:transposase InsO family protein
MTDNGSEFRNHEFDRTVSELGAKHILIRPSRPQSNGKRGLSTHLEASGPGESGSEDGDIPRQPTFGRLLGRKGGRAARNRLAPRARRSESEQGATSVPSTRKPLPAKARAMNSMWSGRRLRSPVAHGSVAYLTSLGAAYGRERRSQGRIRPGLTDCREGHGLKTTARRWPWIPH